MDNLLDQIASIGPQKGLSDDERVKNVLTHPLFMDSLEMNENEQDTINALQSLVFDGTPQGKNCN
jgi:hypothetical protein